MKSYSSVREVLVGWVNSIQKNTIPTYASVREALLALSQLLPATVGSGEYEDFEAYINGTLIEGNHSGAYYGLLDLSVWDSVFEIITKDINSTHYEVNGEVVNRANYTDIEWEALDKVLVNDLDSSGNPIILTVPDYLRVKVGVSSDSFISALGLNTNIGDGVITEDLFWSLLSTPTESTTAEQIDISHLESVKSLLVTVMRYKGSVVNYAALPTTNNSVGDVYNCINESTVGTTVYPAGSNFSWTGTGWDFLGTLAVTYTAGNGIDISGSIISIKLAVESNVTNDSLIFVDTGIKVDTVDNLTTESSTKPLSAGMGKSLKTSIDNLANLLDELFTLEIDENSPGGKRIKANYGVYTNYYSSALGLNSSLGSGGSGVDYLNLLEDVNFEYPVSSGKVLTYSGSYWVPGNVIDGLSSGSITNSLLANSVILYGSSGTLSVSLGGSMSVYSIAEADSTFATKTLVAEIYDPNGSSTTALFSKISDGSGGYSIRANYGLFTNYFLSGLGLNSTTSELSFSEVSWSESSGLGTLTIDGVVATSNIVLYNKIASTTALGIVKASTVSSITGRDYAVAVDSAGLMNVSIPCVNYDTTDTTPVKTIKVVSTIPTGSAADANTLYIKLTS